MTHGLSEVRVMSQFKLWSYSVVRSVMILTLLRNSYHVNTKEKFHSRILSSLAFFTRQESQVSFPLHLLFFVKHDP